MKESDMKSTSETDWDLLDSLTDEAIDRTELPPLDESFLPEPSGGYLKSR